MQNPLCLYVIKRVQPLKKGKPLLIKSLRLVKFLKAKVAFLWQSEPVKIQNHPSSLSLIFLSFASFCIGSRKWKLFQVHIFVNKSTYWKEQQFQNWKEIDGRIEYLKRVMCCSLCSNFLLWMQFLVKWKAFWESYPKQIKNCKLKQGYEYFFDRYPTYVMIFDMKHLFFFW